MSLPSGRAPKALVVAAHGQPFAGLRRERDGDVAIRQLGFELEDELVDDHLDDLLAEASERDRRIETVAEFGREQALDRLFILVFALAAAEADRLLRSIRCAGVRGHDEDHVPEVDLLAVRVGQRAVVHHLQEDVEQIRVRLLDLVEQEHAVRMLVDAVGQQAALVEADIARRRADETRDRVALHVFRHVEAQHLDAEDGAELLGDFRLADAGGAGEQVAADGLVRFAQARAGELDRGGERRDAPCPDRRPRA